MKTSLKHAVFFSVIFAEISLFGNFVECNYLNPGLERDRFFMLAQQKADVKDVDAMVNMLLAARREMERRNKAKSAFVLKTDDY